MENYMKRIFILTLVFVMLFSLFGCGEEEETTKNLPENNSITFDDIVGTYSNGKMTNIDFYASEEFREKMEKQNVKVVDSRGKVTEIKFEIIKTDENKGTIDMEFKDVGSLPTGEVVYKPSTGLLSCVIGTDDDKAIWDFEVMANKKESDLEIYLKGDLKMGDSEFWTIYTIEGAKDSK